MSNCCASWVPSESPPTVHQVWNGFYNLTRFGLRNRLYWGKGKPKGRSHRKRVLGSLLPTVPQRDRQGCLAGNVVWIYVPVEEQYPSLFCLFYKASIRKLPCQWENTQAAWSRQSGLGGPAVYRGCWESQQPRPTGCCRWRIVPVPWEAKLGCSTSAGRRRSLVPASSLARQPEWAALVIFRLFCSSHYS